jgi:PadR family transcriptional regulator PadR
MAPSLRMTAPTMLVLRALLAEPLRSRYGRELCQEAGLKSGTVQPILVRLEEADVVESSCEKRREHEASGRPTLRELAAAPTSLAFATLASPVQITWRSDFADRQSAGWTASRPLLEVHAVPASETSHSSRAMREFEGVLLARLRETGTVSATHGLERHRTEDAITVTIGGQEASTGWQSMQQDVLRGVRFSNAGQLSIWGTLPSDGMGGILDEQHLTAQIARYLRLAGHLRLVDSAALAIAAAIDPGMMLSIGHVEDLARTQASFLSTSDKPIRVHPDESVTQAALDAGAAEIAAHLSRSLIEQAGRSR